MPSTVLGARQGLARGEGPDLVLGNLGSISNLLDDLEETLPQGALLHDRGLAKRSKGGSESQVCGWGLTARPGRAANHQHGTQQGEDPQWQVGGGVFDHSDSGSPLSTSQGHDGLGRMLEMSHVKVTLEMATVNPRGQNEQPRPPEPLPLPPPLPWLSQRDS